MKWYEISLTEEVISPSLLIYPDRVEINANKMIHIAGDTSYLRPHIKTHKMAEIIDLQLKLGILKFKCATIAEAELLAISRAQDILLAMQPVSIQIDRLLQLILTYPGSKFSTVVDNLDSMEELSRKANLAGITLDLWLDINNGMNRTGIQPGDKAKTLYKVMTNIPNINPRGLHVYDGHIHTSNPEQRKKDCDKDFNPIITMKKELEQAGILVDTIVAGGTPTFPIHQKRKGLELSPGTPLLWDEAYQSAYPDLDFIPAAVLMTRIISKPLKDHICLDLGHKSVASEMQLPRVKFLGEHNFQHVSQSEEHLVVKCPNSDKYKIGQCLYAIPSHICPTVAKYPKALTVKNNTVTGYWLVAARNQYLN